MFAAILALVVGTIATAGAHEGCPPTLRAGTRCPSQKAKAKAAAKKAVCATCAISGSHHGAEQVKATLKYKGKQYAFCSLGCKAAFISSPTKYAKARK